MDEASLETADEIQWQEYEVAFHRYALQTPYQCSRCIDGPTPGCCDCALGDIDANAARLLQFIASNFTRPSLVQTCRSYLKVAYWFRMTLLRRREELRAQEAAENEAAQEDPSSSG